MLKLRNHDQPEDQAVIDLLGRERYAKMREIARRLGVNPTASDMQAFGALVSELTPEERRAVVAAVRFAVTVRDAGRGK